MVGVVLGYWECCGGKDAVVCVGSGTAGCCGGVGCKVVCMVRCENVMMCECSESLSGVIALVM